MTVSAFAYQLDSYKTQLHATVTACEPHTENGLYKVRLSDTVLFPEGGGQPDDRGKIGDAEVVKVAQENGAVVHYVNSPLEVGQSVAVSIDWRRRYDHMQQHSGQHLISAIADSMYGYATVTWELGSAISNIEFGAKAIPPEHIEAIEQTCNEMIREARPVKAVIVEDRNDPSLSDKTRRGLPASVVGAVRVVEIAGCDQNLCCGTHVRNLADLQVIKLLSSETARGNARVFFVAGQRALQMLGDMFERERAMTKLLSCGPPQHADNVAKLQKERAALFKANQSQQKEIGQLLGEARARAGLSAPVIMYRPEGDVNFAGAFSGAVGESVLSCVAVNNGQKSKEGQFILAGPKDAVEAAAPKVLAAIDGKGGGKGSVLRGKGANITAQSIKEVEKSLRELSL